MELKMRCCVCEDSHAASAPGPAGVPEPAALIAVDGGGTKTDFVLFRGSGEVLRRVTLEGCNPNTRGLPHAREILAEGVGSLLASGFPVRGLFAGIAGASTGANREALRDFLSGRLPEMKLRVEGDIYNVIGQTGEVRKCIAMICGTGSVVYGFDGESLHRAGGWGYLFDEAGSGFDIGRDALRHCLACDEGERPEDGLSRSVREALGGPAFDRIDTLYAKGRDYIASFAPIVFGQYEKGDETACRIIRRTADRLAELIGRAHARCDCGGTVVAAGGLSARKDILGPLLASRLPPELTLVFPELPPVFGAAVQCMRLVSAEYDPAAFTQKFSQSLMRPGKENT